ncbi:hypothetical protein Pcac1_g5557 [Phytophthora cactorum]|nr:hypothetical protein Pcac1_g5557 [Phytophthora cactorum]
MVMMKNMALLKAATRPFSRKRRGTAIRQAPIKFWLDLAGDEYKIGVDGDDVRASGDSSRQLDRS